MSNSFILPSDNRASRFLRGAGGLTRSDSTTLPRPEHSYGAYSEDVFSISPDAPPIPSDAEALYRPPKKLREGVERGNKSVDALTRQGSGSSVKALPKPPSTASARSSPLLSPGKEFDMADIIHSSAADARRTPPVPRSPLPLPPTPKLPYLTSEDGHSSMHSSKQSSLPDEYQSSFQQFPLDAQLLSPELSPLSSEGPPSGRDLDGVLNYYSLPETPDVMSPSGFQPAFSPISEESSSQLSPPVPYRSSERRDSTRPFGGRSPSSGSPRSMSNIYLDRSTTETFCIARHDSATLPRRPSDRNFSRAPSLLSVAETNASAQVSAYASIARDLLIWGNTGTVSE